MHGDVRQWKKELDGAMSSPTIRPIMLFSMIVIFLRFLSSNKYFAFRTAACVSAYVCQCCWVGVAGRGVCEKGETRTVLE